jgi:hypothetical protein
MKAKFTIGADPEMFLQDANTQQLVSSVGKIEGTKRKPVFLERGTFIMKDNVAIEFGMNPCSSEEEWINTLADSYRQLESFLPDDLQLACLPSAFFPEEELQTAEACEFGCDPDFNAWTRQRNIPPTSENNTFRSCGGHIHVGVPVTLGAFTKHPMFKLNLIRMMDANHGIVSTIIDNSPESIARKELYGKAGCYRPTDYGVEYRTLSNFWLRSPAMQSLMYRLTNDVIDSMADNYQRCAKTVGKAGKLIQHIINDGDTDMAEVWIRETASKWWNGETLTAYMDVREETINV